MIPLYIFFFFLVLCQLEIERGSPWLCGINTPMRLSSRDIAYIINQRVFTWPLLSPESQRERRVANRCWTTRFSEKHKFFVGFSNTDRQPTAHTAGERSCWFEWSAPIGMYVRVWVWRLASADRCAVDRMPSVLDRDRAFFASLCSRRRASFHVHKAMFTEMQTIIKNFRRK